jgi:hypothetical protein
MFVIAANLDSMEIDYEVNSRLPNTEQYGFLAARWKAFEILRRHKEFFPESKLADRSIKRFLIGICCFVCSLAFLFY